MAWFLAILNLLNNNVNLGYVMASVLWLKKDEWWLDALAQECIKYWPLSVFEQAFDRFPQFELESGGDPF